MFYLKYIKINERVLKMKELTANDKLLSGLLYSLSTNEGYVFAKNNYLAEMLGVSVDVIKRSLKNLKDLKLIEIKNSNRYRKIYLKELDDRPKIENHIVISDEVNIRLDDIWNRIKN